MVFSNQLQNNSILSSKISIVDDSSLGRSISKKHLNDSGFCNVADFSNSLEFLENLKEGNKPDILITDLYMPDFDGFKLIKKLKNNELYKEIPILVQTTATDQSERNHAFKLGASELLRKPLDKEEFIYRISLHLENYLYKNRISKELESARELQNSIFPTQKEINQINQSTGIDIATFFKPSFDIGGDFWGLKQSAFSEVVTYVCDISGHGVASAANALRVHGYINEAISSLQYPEYFAKKLNRKINKMLPSGHFAATFFAMINFETNKLNCCNCGLPYPILIKSNGECKILKIKGTPLGATAESNFEAHSYDFNKGDKLIIYTDGLIETANEKGTFLNEENICYHLKNTEKMSSEETLNHLYLQFKEHTSGLTPEDDLTITIIRNNGKEQKEQS